jgi:nitrogen fixation protein NifU and related proteins
MPELLLHRCGGSAPHRVFYRIDNPALPQQTFIPMYSHRVLKQFQNSRRVGDLPDADVYVQVENPACGDVLRMSMKVHSGNIVDARFRAKGCVAAIACGAQLADMICNKSLAEVATIKREDVIAGLEGLPETSTHASHLAMDALAQALKQLR